MADVDERWVLTAADQRSLDARAIASGVDEDALMDSAGTNAAAWILGRLRPRRTVVVAGPGGNGGDGLVVARRLHEAGRHVETSLLSSLSSCSPLPHRL